ncbi:MAG: transposase, partial [Gammaproteobacteria bacterium]|nr:transposase [Gammaproteobacteria bacterium]
MQGTEWFDAGQGWQGAETTLRLQGWSRERRVVVLRRGVKKDLAVVDKGNPEQLRLSFAELSDNVTLYE